MSEKRTVDEIAAAHAKAMDDMWTFLYPANNPTVLGTAQRVLAQKGGRAYFQDWARADMRMMQLALTRGDR